MQLNSQSEKLPEVVKIFKREKKKGEKEKKEKERKKKKRERKSKEKREKKKRKEKFLLHTQVLKSERSVTRTFISFFFVLEEEI